jgi:hypothetical protein
MEKVENWIKNEVERLNLNYKGGLETQEGYYYFIAEVQPEIIAEFESSIFKVSKIDYRLLEDCSILLRVEKRILDSKIK